jgi:hypothetical protein
MDITHNQTDAMYNGFKPFAEESQWGPKQGVRMQFKITKGKFLNQNVSYKGNFFQDQQTGKWVVGMKSKLAEVIRVITGGTETINKGHVGTKVLIVVKCNTSKKNGSVYANVESVLPMPKFDDAPAPVQQPAPTMRTTTEPVAPQSTQPAAKNSTLLDDLTDLSDFGK